jgi:hypothetical protein
MKISKHFDFLLALSIVFVAVVLSIVVYDRILIINFFVFNMRFSHLLSIVGAIGIGLATPLFTLLKRSYSVSWVRITRFHIFGNLLFFTFIVFHFASQMARPSSSFPDLGTGLAMFVAMGLQIAFGFTQRFGSQARLGNRSINVKTVKFVHASLVMVFYLIILFHVLHGFRII